MLQVTLPLISTNVKQLELNKYSFAICSNAWTRGENKRKESANFSKSKRAFLKNNKEWSITFSYSCLLVPKKFNFC